MLESGIDPATVRFYRAIPTTQAANLWFGARVRARARCAVRGARARERELYIPGHV